MTERSGEKSRVIEGGKEGRGLKVRRRREERK